MDKKILIRIAIISLLAMPFQNCAKDLPASLDHASKAGNDPAPCTGDCTPDVTPTPTISGPQPVDNPVQNVLQPILIQRAPVPLFGNELQMIMEPAPMKAKPGDTFNLKALAITDVGTVKYQWKKGNTPINGATSNVLTLTNVDSSALGDYSVDYMNGSVTLTSRFAFVEVLTANAKEFAPKSAVVLQNKEVNLGDHVILDGNIDAVPAPAFQWYKDGIPIPYGDGRTLALTKVNADSAGEYSVIASNSKGYKLFKVVNLTIANSQRAPALITGLNNLNLKNNDRLTLKPVFDYGAPAAAVRWYKNGVEMAALRQFGAFTIPSFGVADEGTYTVAVTNGIGAKIVVDSKVLYTYWTEFANSGGCSKVCGGGQQLQVRQCKTSEGDVSNDYCAGGAVERTRNVACNTKSCDCASASLDVGAKSYSGSCFYFGWTCNINTKVDVPATESGRSVTVATTGYDPYGYGYEVTYYGGKASVTYTCSNQVWSYFSVSAAGAY